jgi:hypothetical protein
MRARTTTGPKVTFASRVSAWLGKIIRKEQLADPQWAEETRRERTGEMGENIRTEEEARDPNR